VRHYRTQTDKMKEIVFGLGIATTLLATIGCLVYLGMS
jgi:hypothetical protein